MKSPVDTSYIVHNIIIGEGMSKENRHPDTGLHRTARTNPVIICLYSKGNLKLSPIYICANRSGYIAT